MKEKISIIVPIYNVEKYLDKCIRSIINQSYKNIEIILINDGSTDKSGEICDYYSTIDKRIKIIHKKNEGVSVARNLGISLSKGKYIGFVDSDDWISEFMYEKMYEYMENNQLVMCRYCRVDDNGYIIHTNEPLKYGELNKDQIFKNILLPMIGSEIDNLSTAQIMGSNWRCLYDKSIIDKYDIKFENIKIAEDMLFHVMYLGRIDKIFVINEELYYYRYNPISATSNYIDQLWSELINQSDLLEKALKDIGLLNSESKERLIASRLYFICWCISNETHINNPKKHKDIIREIKYLCSNEYSKKIFTFKNIFKMNFKEMIVHLCLKLKLYEIYYFYKKIR